jgi:phasin family protein
MPSTSIAFQFPPDIAFPHVRSQIAIWTRLASSAFENMRSITDLNLRVWEASMEDASSVGRRLMSITEAQDVLVNTVGQAQPQLERMLEYSRELSGIWAKMQADLVQAVKAEADESQHSMEEMAEQSGGQGPDSMLSAVDFVKSAFDSANATYERFLQTAEESTAALQSSLHLNPPSASRRSKARTDDA